MDVPPGFLPRPEFSVLAHAKFTFDPQELINKVWETGGEAIELNDFRENVGFAAKIAYCDAVSFTYTAAILAGVSNGGSEVSGEINVCFLEALIDKIKPPLGWPTGDPFPPLK